MANSFLKWVQDFIHSGKEAMDFLTSKPFAGIPGLSSDIKNLTPLALIGLGGLLVFIIAAVVKWVIS